MEQQQTTIDMVNGLAEIADYMQDEELTTALTFIAKIIIKPDIPLNVAHIEIVRLQAIAAKMAFKATWMANVDKSDRGKKNLYYTAAESLNNLVSALKYITRYSAILILIETRNDDKKFIAYGNDKARRKANSSYRYSRA